MGGLKVAFRATFFIFFLLFGNLVFITRSFLHYSRHTLTFSSRDRSFKVINHINSLSFGSRSLQINRRNVWSHALFARKTKSSDESESDPDLTQNKSTQHESASTISSTDSIEAQPPASQENKRGRPKKPSDIYTQPDSVTFSRETMNSKIISANDGQRKKISKQELLAEMNDLDEVMGKMEDILPLSKTNTGKKSSKEFKGSKSSTKSPASRGGSGGIDGLRAVGGKKNELDEIEEGFLKFLENNDVDVEFQRIQESLENFNEDELDPTLLPPSVSEGEGDEGIVDDIDFDLLQRDIRSKTKSGVKSKISPFIDEDEEDEDNIGLKKKSKKNTSLLPNNGDSITASVPSSPSQIVKRKAGRKRKDEDDGEEDFDIPSYLNKEFYGNQLSTSNPPPSPPLKDEDIAEDDEDLFFNEALQLTDNRKKINMKEELSKMEKVLRNFDNEFPSSNLEQYSLPNNPSFNVPKSQVKKRKLDSDDEDDEEEMIDTEDDDTMAGKAFRGEDDEDEEEEALFQRFESQQKRGRGRPRSAYKGAYDLEGGHNITAEEMKEVLSSFDDDDDDVDDDDEEADRDLDDVNGSKRSSSSASSSSSSSDSPLISPTGNEYEFDFESLFQRMNYTENLERELLSERARKKEIEIQKIRKKLAELTRMTNPTGKTKTLGPRDKNKAIKELQFQLLSLEDELESIESVRDGSSPSSRQHSDRTTSSVDDDSDDEKGERGEEELEGEDSVEEDNENDDEDDSSQSIWEEGGEIITAEEYDIIHNPTGRDRRRRSQKRTLRNYFQDLPKGEEIIEDNESDEEDSDDILGELGGDSDTSSSSSSSTTTSYTSTPPEMTEEQYIRADIPFDEIEVRREKVRLTQTSLVQVKKPGTDEVVEVNVTTPMVIDARYPDWKLDVRDYINHVNVTKIIEEGPNWDLLPSENETELLKYAQQIYKRLSYEQDLFYDSSYAYIPPSMREERNEEGQIEPKSPPQLYPQEPHDVHLQLADDEPMHSRLVVTTVLSYMNTTEELRRGIAVIKKLYDIFDQELNNNDQVEYQLWIYCEDFIRSPYVIAEPIFRRYDYNLTRYLSDLSPEEHLFTLAYKEEEAMQAKMEEKRNEKKAAKVKKMGLIPAEDLEGVRREREEVEEDREQRRSEPGVKEDNSDNMRSEVKQEVLKKPVSRAATGASVIQADAEDLINYYYLMSENHQKDLKQQVDKASLQSEELWRSSLEGVMQMWCEGYNSYHLINGKLMKDIWGGINPDVLFAPKNLNKLVHRVKEALAEDSYDALYLPPRMEEDWRFGDMLYPPENLTEIDYGLDE